MPLFVNKKATYPFQIKDPETEEVWNIVLRKMNEGDQMRRTDLTTRTSIEDRRRRKNGQRKKADKSYMEYAFGKIRMFDLQTSLVEWDFVFPPDDPRAGQPVPLTERYIAMLDPWTADAIHDRVEELNPFIFRQDRGEDEEEEFDEDQMPYEEAVAPLAPDQVYDEQEYAEEEGPT